MVFFNGKAEDTTPYLTTKVCDADHISVTVVWHQSIVILHDSSDISMWRLPVDKGLNQTGLADHPVPHDWTIDR